jgi:hypothetical protein
VRRRLFLVLGLSLATLVAVVLLEPTRVLWGLLRNESFYRNRPTSYWRAKVHRDIYFKPSPSTTGGWFNLASIHREELYGLQTTLGEAPDPAAIPVLVELLDDEDSQVCFFACNTLVGHGPEAAAAIPALRKLLRLDIFHRRHAVKGLAAIGSPARAALPDLIEALHENDSCVNYYAAVALGKLGPDAREALPLLKELRQSDRAKESYMGPGNQDHFINPGRDTVGYAVDWALSEIDPDRQHAR